MLQSTGSQFYFNMNNNRMSVTKTRTRNMNRSTFHIVESDLAINNIVPDCLLCKNGSHHNENLSIQIKIESFFESFVGAFTIFTFVRRPTTNFKIHFVIQLLLFFMLQRYHLQSSPSTCSLNTYDVKLKSNSNRYFVTGMPIVISKNANGMTSDERETSP